MISLVIPTYNRPDFLERLLRYYQELKCPYMIVVADSSSAPAYEANQNLVDTLQDSLSIHYQGYRSDINPYLKVAQTLDAVDSKYAVFCADDDFIIPNGVEQCVRFLETNPDYAIAHGRTASVVLWPDHNLNYNLTSHTYPQRTIDFDDPRLRLQDHLMNYAPTFYSVHRRSELMRNIRLTYDNTIDHRFGELLPSCLSLIQGKAKCLNTLYMVRQSNPNSTSKNVPSWGALLAFDDFSQRYGQISNCLAQELVGVADVSMVEAKAVVDQAFQAYLEPKLPVSNTESLPVWRNRLNQVMQRFGQVIRILPAAGYSAFRERQLVAMFRSPRKAYRQLQHKQWLLLNRQQDDMLIDKLLDPQSPFYADFLPIYEHMRRYFNRVVISQKDETGEASDATH